MTEIATTRLILRPFTPADSDELFAIRGDAEAMRFWDVPGDRDVEQGREVARLFAREMAEGAALYMTARLAEGSFVGLFDLSELGGARADLGFMVVRGLWGRGYGLEGAEAMVREARRRKLEGLKARVHVGNLASRRLLLKLGFVEGAPPQPVEVTPGRLVDCALLELDL